MDIAKITADLTNAVRGGVPISLSTLAQHHGYSKWHLSREFRRHTGYSIREYIEALKIQCGVENLDEHGMNVSDSAAASGYASLGTFSNTFHQHTGLKASTYNTESRSALHLLTRILDRKGTLYHHEPVPHDAVAESTITISAIYPNDYQPHITCIGLFPTGIPKGPPIVGAALFRHTQVTLPRIPAGNYYLLACDLQFTTPYSQVVRENFRQKVDQPLQFPATSGQHFTLHMRPPIPEDPPITMNFPALISRTIHARIKQKHNHRNSQ